METATLGPPGTSARAAARALLGPEAAAGATEVAGPRAALQGVADGSHDVAVVPWEDSRTGADAETVDTLVFELADLVVAAEADLVDEAATTRWVLVRPIGVVVALADDVAAQSTFFAVPQLNRPGVLTEMLAAFSSRGINVGRFAPRPLHGALGMYGFVLEAEGHPGQPWFADAVADLVAASSTVTHLGTFPIGERAWSTVTGRSPAGRVLTDRRDLRDLVDAWTARP